MQVNGKDWFLFMMHLHDHIWEDKVFTLKVRREACQMIEEIILNEHHRKYLTEFRAKGKL